MEQEKTHGQLPMVALLLVEVHGTTSMALSDDKRIVSVRLESDERESHGDTPMEAFAGRMSTMARRRK